MASVYPRRLKGGVVWYAQVRMRGGAWKGFNTQIGAQGGHNRVRAMRAAMRIQAEIDAGRDPFRETTQSPMLSAMSAKFLQERAPFWAPNSLRDYADSLRQFQRSLGDIPVGALDADSVARFRINLRCPSPHSKNHHLRNIRVFLRWCGVENQIPNWKAPRIEFLPVAASGHRDYYTAEECKRTLIAAELIKVNGVSLSLFLQVLILTGMRLGEALALRREWIDFERNEIRIPPAITKSKRRRVIPVMPRLKELLKEGTEAKVFPFSAKSGYLREVWQRVTKIAGVRYLKLHNLRDTYAVNMLLAGVPLATVSQILGHASVTTTIKHYAEFASDELSRAVRKADEFTSDILRGMDKSRNVND